MAKRFYTKEEILAYELGRRDGYQEASKYALNIIKRSKIKKVS